MHLITGIITTLAAMATTTVATPLGAAASGVCTPGSYRCTQDRLGHTYNIEVCTAEGQWKINSVCGGLGCCKYTVNGVPYCAC